MRASSVCCRAGILLAAFVAPIAANAHSVSADRMVAEWTLRMGGSVIVAGQNRPIAELMDLPAGDFQIRTLNLTGVTMGAYGLRDELRRLPPLPHLKELYLNGRLWYDQPPVMVADTLTYFAPCTELEKLVFSRPVQTSIPINDSILKRVPLNTNLKEARLLQTLVAGESLKPLTELRYLDLSFNDKFGDAGMAGLPAMHSLTKLYLSGTSVTDAGLKQISGLSALTELDLSGAAITDAGIANLAHLTHLRRLELAGSKITDAGLDALRGMGELEILNLYRTRVSDAGVAKLAGLKQLRALDLRYTRATGSAVQTMAAAVPDCRIEFQGASGAAATHAIDIGTVKGKGEDAVAAWVRSTGGKATMRDGHITAVQLSGAAITDEAVDVLTALPGLGELNLHGSEVSDGTVSKLAVSQVRSRLRRLSLKYADVTDQGIEALVAFPQLTHLDLAGVDTGDAGLAAIGKLKELEDLNLSYGRFTDRGVQALANLTNLRRLDLTQTKIGDQAMDALAGLVKLQALDLSYTTVGDAGLAKLRALTALTDLHLDQAEVTDASLKMLAGMRGLRQVDLYHTLVTDQGVKALNSALPDCRVLWDRDSGRRERRS